MVFGKPVAPGGAAKWQSPSQMENPMRNMLASDSRQQRLLLKGWAARVMMACVATLATVSAVGAETKQATEQEKKMTVGVYYYDGWAGRNQFADDPKEPWARNAPTQLTRRMVEEFPEREPVWGWRDDSVEIMERQIGLAADHGLSFFAFCWYWRDNGGAVNERAIKAAPENTSLELFLKAKNNQRLKFCLMVANHEGFEIKGTEHWKQAADYWMRYLKHPQCVTVGGKPLLIIYNTGGGDKDGLAYLQDSAQKAGLSGVAVAGCGSGALETCYTLRTHYNYSPGWTAGSEPHKYAELVAATQAVWGGSREQPYMPLIVAGGDKRPWEGPTGLNQAAGWYYPDRAPEQFARFLRDAVSWMDKHPHQTTAERIVLIYAWNEFGEGGYIAPTRGDPDGEYLQALRSVVLPACRPAQPGATKEEPMELIEARKIWDQAPHNAFTDLVRFQNRWFCVFREGKAHSAPDGALRVITSPDGRNWESAALITSPNSDLRDPKINISPDGRLMLCAAEALHNTSKHTHQSLAWFSKDGRTWSDRHEIGEPDIWLWRVTWHKGKAYGVGYGCGKDHFVRLYTSGDGKKFDALVDRLFDAGNPSEASLVFDGDTACCLLRRDGASALSGVSQPPYTQWIWADLGVCIGGPQMLRLPDGRFVAAVRLYDGGERTSLCWINPQTGKLKESLKLPSGGDTSYPGLVLHDGLLWVSYYSSHEGKAAVYLAKVKVDQ